MQIKKLHSGNKIERKDSFNPRLLLSENQSEGWRRM